MLDSYKYEHSLKRNYCMNESNKESNKNNKYSDYLKRKYMTNLLLIIPIGYSSILFYMYITKS